MPFVNVRSVNIFHEVHGDHGPWLALNSGGRHRYLEMEPLARLIASKGYRVLVHDRRNTGASQIEISGQESEDEIWADDLQALMAYYGAHSAFYGGSSAGSRLAMTVKRRHPNAVKGLILMRVTGGDFAAGRLPNIYYGQFIKAAQQGGMEAVCSTESYRERIALSPDNLNRLMAMDPIVFIQVMSNWLNKFTSGPTGPVMGISENELRAYQLPVLIVPGNDKTHSSANGIDLAKLVPDSELFTLPIQDHDVDLIPFPDWREHYPALANKFADFMLRHANDGSCDK